MKTKKETAGLKSEISRFREGQLRIMIPSEGKKGEIFVGQIEKISLGYPGLINKFRGVTKLDIKLRWCAKEIVFSRNTILGAETAVKYEITTKFMTGGRKLGRLTYLKEKFGQCLVVEIPPGGMKKTSEGVSFITLRGEECLLIRQTHPLAVPLRTVIRGK